MSLKERQLKGLKILHENSIQTQKVLLSYLENLQESGEAKNIKSHWLTNRISVEIAILSLNKTANHTDIISIFQEPKLNQITPETPIDKDYNTKYAGSNLESNLTYIGADSAWKMGYTGKGRIVCVFDPSGVERNHPALFNNWKGRFGDSVTTWNGDHRRDAYPDPSMYHGTHLAGIMVGHDEITGDTIGVAPGAEWIGGGFYDFEWAADPDGNPNTTSDMPDVINISWGFYGDCKSFMSEQIDKVEALGIVVVCAAGNGGSGPMTIGSPGNRADDSLTEFAVGSIDRTNSYVWWSSSRGPSLCDSISIKPNVCAPGVRIRSSIPNGQYEIHGGTSMAAPHVAGAVAILRQYAPDATSREIKEALIGGATHTGSPYPNNYFGWGIINIPASIEFLANRHSADIRISAFEYDPVNVTDTLTATIQLTNYGYSTDSVFAAFEGSSDGIQVLTDSIYFGELQQGDTIQGFFKCIFDDTMNPGPIITTDFVIHRMGGFVDSATFFIQAGNAGEPSYYTHKTDRLHFTVSNYGQYDIGGYTINDTINSGFRFGDTTINHLSKAALFIGLDSNHVSDGYNNSGKINDDFWINAFDQLVVESPGLFADQETECEFTDGRAKNQIGINLKQRTYSWSDIENNNYVIMEYQVTNISTQYLNSFVVGLGFQWHYTLVYCDSILNFDLTRGIGYSANFDLSYVYSLECTTYPAQFRGLTILNNEGANAHSIISNRYFTYNGFSEKDKFASLFGEVIDTTYNLNFRNDHMLILSSGPFTLAPGESDTVAFAVIGANSLDELQASSLRAKGKWTTMRTMQFVPETYILAQNYPNPFNSSTIIKYGLPVRSHTSIDIYNILGQQVNRLIDRETTAGNHQITWDGKNSSGNDVSSGIYFYRIRTDNFDHAKKMVLLK